MIPPFKPKSPPQPVVPSTDPRAPYGRDEKDRPIGVPQGLELEQRDQRQALERKSCIHGEDFQECADCRATDAIQTMPKNIHAFKDHEDLLKTQLQKVMDAHFEESRKLGREVDWPALAHAMQGAFRDLNEESIRKKSDSRSFRELLGLSRTFISSLFGRTMGAEDVPIKVKVLKDKTQLEQEISELVQHIAEIKELLATRSAAYQKRHRPDDKLEKKDRERLKRQETIQLAKNEKGLREARLRLKNWGQDPRDYDVTIQMKRVPIIFGEKYAENLTYRRAVRDVEFVKDKERKFMGQVTHHTEIMTFIDSPVGIVYDIDGYRRLLQEAILRGEQNVNFEGWEEWENKVITEAVRVRAMKVPPGASKELGIYVPPDDRHEQDHIHEEALIRKTGGAQIGGGVYARGTRNGKQRGLEDFNQTSAFNGVGGEPGGEAPDAPDPDGDNDSWSPD